MDSNKNQIENIIANAYNNNKKKSVNAELALKDGQFNWQFGGNRTRFSASWFVGWNASVELNTKTLVKSINTQSVDV